MKNNAFGKQSVSFGVQITSQDIFQEEDSMSNQVKFLDGQQNFAKDDQKGFGENQSKKARASPKLNKDVKIFNQHNFQKHAVITIKKLMKMPYDPLASQEQKLAFKMWNIFMVSGIKTKKLLVILFGCVNCADQRNRTLFIKSGFGEILDQSETTIRKAQQVLRNRFVVTVTDDMIHEDVQKFRKIYKSQEFLLYFLELAKMIRKGPYTKLRMDIENKRNIQTQLKDDKAIKEMMSCLD